MSSATRTKIDSAATQDRGTTARSAVVEAPAALAAGGAAMGRLQPSDLADLLAAFNEVTTKLETSHRTLQGEVARLNRELRDANEQLERSRRLAALGEMAAGIAHEVRNPLGSIRLYARMLEQDLSDRPGQAGIAAKIAAAAKGLDGVVGDVLTFSKEFRLRAAPVDPAAVFEAAIEACSHDGIAGWRSIVIEREFADGLCFEGDESLVSQAVTNIVRNAYEAMLEAGNQPGANGHRVLLSTRGERLAIHGRRLVRACIMSVSDNGPGVAPEVVERMFNPFFTTRHTGTGLGLAIVHRIVDAHGGRVRVTSRAESGDAGGRGARGTTVDLIFPLTQDAAAQGEVHAGHHAGDAKE